MPSDQGLCFQAAMAPPIIAGVYIGLFLSCVITACTEPTVFSHSFVSLMCVAAFTLVRVILTFATNKSFGGDGISDIPYTVALDSFPDCLYYFSVWMLVFDQFESITDAIRYRIGQVESSSRSVSLHSARSSGGIVLTPTSSRDISKSEDGILHRRPHGSPLSLSGTITTTGSLRQSLLLRSPTSDFDSDDYDYIEEPKNTSVNTLTPAPDTRSFSPADPSPASGMFSNVDAFKNEEDAAILRFVRVPTYTNGAVMRFCLRIYGKKATIIRWSAAGVFFFLYTLTIGITAWVFKDDPNPDYDHVVISENVYRGVLFLIMATVLLIGFIAFDTARPGIMMICVMLVFHTIIPLFFYIKGIDCSENILIWTFHMTLSECVFYIWFLLLIYHNMMMRLRQRVLYGEKKKGDQHVDANDLDDANDLEAEGETEANQEDK